MGRGLAIAAIIILLLIGANAFLAAAEIAVVSVRRSRIRHLAAEGDRRAQRVAALHADPDRFFATVQVGLTMVATLASVIAGAAAVRWIEPLIRRLWPDTSPGLIEAAALLAVSGIVAYLTIVFGELVPKSLALRAAEGMSLKMAGAIRGLSRLFAPAVKLLTVSSNLVLRPFGDKTSFSEARVGPEEIKLLIEESARVGSLGPVDRDILSRFLTFAELTAGEIKVPRTDVVMLDVGADQEEMRRVIERGHTRVPVVRGSLDKVVGFITAKDALRQMMQVGHMDIQTLLRPPFFVPESIRIKDLMRQLQQQRLHLAFTVDEFGGVSGLVTLEDVLEELVGEIFEEHEVVTPSIQRQPDGAALVAGRLPLHEFNRDMPASLPEEERARTVGGFVTALAGRIPAQGESFLADGLKLTVTQRSERRVRQVKVERVTPPAE